MNFDKNTLIINSSSFDDDGDAGEVITLMTQEDEDQLNKSEKPSELPIMPVRNTVLFPGVVFPITVGRDKSIKLIKDAHKGNKLIGVNSQVDEGIEDPEEKDIHRIGTLARILKMLRMPDGNTTVIIQGVRKYEIKEFISTEPYFKAKVDYLKERKPKKDQKTKALIDSVREMATKIVEVSPNIPSEANFALKNIDSPNFLVNFISSNLNISVAEKQEILKLTEFHNKTQLVLSHLDKELQVLELKNQIQNKVKVDLDKQQREYFLHQQMRAIQEELGHDSPDKELENLRARGAKMKWDKNVDKTFNKELNKLGRMNPSAPDYSVGMNYCELLLDLPWNEFTEDNFDLTKAKKILDKDHSGLEKVKDRILEFLAVLKMKGDMKSPILCLYGPPGVGKTSLGKSLAKAMGREYIRMSLGGLHDEAELRGHRKTYIGAMPGRIIQSLKKAGSSNPVFVLDEIDKIGNDFRGDPSSALLEILDPEQNKEFHDNYVDLDYDLSRVMFVATANSLRSIQPALRDRMEIIEISGYTLKEKLNIAKKHLVPKQRKEHGLKASEIKFSDKVLENIIDEYTRESGVRTLEKRIATLCRNRVKNIVYKNKYKVPVAAEEVEKVLREFKREKEVYENNEIAGLVTGLAWTSVGGTILMVESTLMSGSGSMKLTGQLGSVMKESAELAKTYLKSNAKSLGINPLLFKQYDMHVHFPAGAIPKDGPSAGITILTSLASTITQRKIRKNLAMTGEITLRGKVLPVGGIKEKVLAAKRAGIKEIILCENNKKDILEIKDDGVKGLKFHYVKHMQEVLDIALLKQKVSNSRTWTIKEKKSS